MAQVNQGEIGKYQTIGDLQVERTGVEVERSNFIEYPDHRVDRLCHQFNPLR
jgi:hypothetical protein